MSDEQRAEELAAIIKPALPNHCCGPDDMDDCPYDAHDAHGVAKAVIEAEWMKVDGPYSEIFERQRGEIFDLSQRLDKALSTSAYHQVMADGLGAKVGRAEALAEALDKKSEEAYERRYVEDWAYYEGCGDVYDEAARLIRAALADEGSTDLGT